MHEVELTGLDGSNLLAYLAALGTFRVLSQGEEAVRMSWREKGWWTPVIHSDLDSADALLERLAPRLLAEEGAIPNDAFSCDVLDIPASEFRVQLASSIDQPHTRQRADFLGSLGSDCVDNPSEPPRRSELCAVSAGNNEGFIAFIRTINSSTSKEQLRKALFATWSYDDPPPFMRWDPNEYRPHALRAMDPARDRKQNNVRGANRLAIEALPFFPLVPRRRSVQTIAFTRSRHTATMTWPIWADLLELDTVQCLLSHADTDSTALRGIGMMQIYCAERFTDSAKRYVNFSPARELL